MSTTQPCRGEIWYVDFNPTRGHEQAGNRPALMVSVDLFNHSAAGLVIVLLVTSQAKGIRSHIQVNPPEGGLRKTSYIKCEDIRSVSTERLTRRCGKVSRHTMGMVENCVRILLGL